MASANFLEEALSTDVDESAVNAIVGSLENQLTTTSNIIGNNEENIIIVTSGNNTIVSNGGPIITSQKHGVANGEIINNNCVVFNNSENKINLSNNTNGNKNLGTFISNREVTVRHGQGNKIFASSISSGSAISTTYNNNNNNTINQSLSSYSSVLHPQLQTTSTSNMPKSNEPIKLVYPTIGGTTVGGGNIGVSQTSISGITTTTGSTGHATGTVLNMNNRLSFTSQPLPNGSIGLSPLTTSQQSTIMQTSSSAVSVNTGTIGGVRNLSQPQQQTLVIKNQAVSMPSGLTSSSPGIVTMTKSLNQVSQQNIVGQSMIPASVQIVNMRPGTPTTQTQQKSVATVPPTRVVIGGSQMVGQRPQNSAITLSSIQNLPAGQAGSALLLKTESGQYQLLRVGPAPAQNVTSNMVSSANQTIRLQTVPAVSRFTGPPLTLRKTIVTQQQVKQKQNQGIATSAGTIIVNSSLATATPLSHVITTTSAAPPPVASVAPLPALTPQNTTVVMSQTPTQQQQQQRNTSDNTKEKCRKFLANLLELSSREPKPVERNVRTLIQELIDANVEPEEFCERLERLLNASPQPCLIGFLKKSLPLLRQSLVRKELLIEGINPPPHNVAFSNSTTITTQMPAQVRQIGQTVVSSGPVQSQIRMVSGIRSGQTTITRHTAPVRIQGPIQTTGPRLINASVSQIRPGNTTIVQTNSIQQHQQQQLLQQQQSSTTPPALQPVSVNNNQTVIIPAAQIRTQATVSRPSTVQIRATTPILRTPVPKAPAMGATMKVGQTQIKQIPNPNIPAPVIANNATPAVTTISSTIISHPNNKTIAIKSQNITQTQKVTVPKEKEKKISSSYYHQTAAISMSSSMYGDDDINDVAAMGGVNLAEESQRIMGSTELIGTQIRSCKDEIFLHMPALQSKIRQIIARHGLEEPSNEVSVLISHATQERLKNIVEKLAVIAEHRIDVIKVDPRYEITKDVRGQIKFLEELDKAEQKRHEEQEREMLLRAAKSRSKTEDPEQAKLKAKAKEMQRAEMDELRMRDSNLTALLAIGPRKKPRLDGDTATASVTGTTTAGTSGTPSVSRPRIKRVNLKDMLFYLEQERDTCRSNMLYKAYLK